MKFPLSIKRIEALDLHAAHLLIVNQPIFFTMTILYDDYRRFSATTKDKREKKDKNK